MQTNKQRDIDELRRRVVRRRIVCLSLFLPSIVLLVVGGVFDLGSLVGVGVALIVISIITFVVMGDKIWGLKKRIETYCSQCDTASLVYTRTTKEKTGEVRVEYSSGVQRHENELVRETKYYRCRCCGNETRTTSTSNLRDW